MCPFLLIIALSINRLNSKIQRLIKWIKTIEYMLFARELIYFLRDLL